jgi:hypothetical protein
VADKAAWEPYVQANAGIWGGPSQVELALQNPSPEEAVVTGVNSIDVTADLRWPGCDRKHVTYLVQVPGLTLAGVTERAAP